MNNPFEQYRDRVRAEADAKAAGSKVDMQVITEFVDALKRGRVRGESCEHGLLDGDVWRKEQTELVQLSGGEYRRFDLKISVSSSGAAIIEHIYLGFLIKMSGSYHAILHSEDIRHHATESTANIALMDKEHERYADALRVFDSAVRHKYKS